MEDSGREDLLKQKSAEVADAQNKASDEKVDFNSSEIGQKEKEEQFKEIEGAEERAREAERLKEKAKRDKEKADEAAAKALKKEEETPLQKKARHKKNWIIAAIILAVFAVLALLGFLWWKSENISEIDAQKEALAVFSQAKDILGNGNAESRKKAKEFFNEQINKKHGTKKFYLLLKYADYLNNYKYPVEEIRKTYAEAEQLVKTEQMRKDLLTRRCYVLVMYDAGDDLSACDELYEEEPEHELGEGDDNE